MESLRPEQATFLLQCTLPALKNEHKLTKRTLAAIPLDKGDYRPDSICKPAIDLAWHIAAAENMFIEAVVSGAFDFTGRGRPDSVKNSADLVAWYEEKFDGNLKNLEQLSGEQLIKVVDFRGMLKWPAVEFLQLGLRHSVHHRGQLSTYLRPMGAKVPSIYGESYDDVQARKAAEAAA